MISPDLKTVSPKKQNFLTTAVQEVIGDLDLLAVGTQFNLTQFHSADMRSLWIEMEQRFGDLGCSGIANRIGRSTFKYGLIEFGSIMGAAGLEFRLSPTRKKLLLSLKALSEILEKYLGLAVELDDAGSHFLLSAEGMEFFSCSPSYSAASQLLKGMAQAALDWASGGKYYLVELIDQNPGNFCRLKISSSPI